MCTANATTYPTGCPNGEAPGIIPDIKLWAARNGWPVPKRPKKQPMFFDREYKPGEFID